MAVVGALGEIVFQVSDEVVQTLENWKWSGSARYAVHNRHASNALTEFTGLDPDKITFDMTLLAEMGVDPMDTIVKLWNYERTGEAVPFSVGSHCYGRYRWNVVNHSVTVKYTNAAGDITGAVVSVSLQEYLRGGETAPAPWEYPGWRGGAK